MPYYLMTQCWYPGLKTIADHKGERTVPDGEPKPLRAPVKFDRVREQDGKFSLMQIGEDGDENVLYSWGRTEAIEQESIEQEDDAGNQPQQGFTSDEMRHVEQCILFAYTQGQITEGCAMNLLRLDRLDFRERLIEFSPHYAEAIGFVKETNTKRSPKLENFARGK